MSVPNGASGRPETRPEGGRIVRFDGFEFDLEGLVLTREGQRVRLQPQPSRVLAELVRAQGAVVTREQLRDAIWGDRFVEFDQGLNFCIRQIRSALADEADTPRFVETVPRRGYRFLTPIEAAPGGGAPVDPKRRSTSRTWAPVVAAAGLALAAVGWIAWPGGDPATLDDPAGPDQVAARELSAEARLEFLAAGRWLRARTSEGYQRAAAGFDVVLAQHPDFIAARVGRAEAWLWTGKTADARRELDAVLTDHPGESRSHTLRGALALFRDWDLDAAGRHLRMGADLAPSSSVANHFLAYYHLVTGDTSSARKSIELALRLDPLSPTLQGDAGLVFYWLRDYRRGRESCRLSLASGPFTRSALYCIFLNEGAYGRIDSVVAVARELAALDSAPAAVQAELLQGRAGLDRYLDWETGRLATLPDEGSGTSLPMARLRILRGRPDQAKAVLAAGLRRHSNSLVFVEVEPLLDPIRGDTLVQRVAHSVGLPPIGFPGPTNQP